VIVLWLKGVVAAIFENAKVLPAVVELKDSQPLTIIGKKADNDIQAMVAYFP
jgi:hypothetical protein